MAEVIAAIGTAVATASSASKAANKIRDAPSEIAACREVIDHYHAFIRRLRGYRLQLRHDPNADINQLEIVMQLERASHRTLTRAGDPLNWAGSTSQINGADLTLARRVRETFLWIISGKEEVKALTRELQDDLNFIMERSKFYDFLNGSHTRVTGTIQLVGRGQTPTLAVSERHLDAAGVPLDEVDKVVGELVQADRAAVELE